jgi:acyl transferase domain-containing protein
MGAHEQRRDVAIVGMACRLPGASDYDQFFHNLLRGHSAVRALPPDRRAFLGQKQDQAKQWLAALEGLDRFDHEFFQISERDAAAMDPEQRLLLEECWHAIEDSGLPLSRLKERRTSVHVEFYGRAPHVQWSHDLGLASRISRVLDLKGASVSIDTAGAASLVAVHEAKRALERGESDYAIAAGVTLHLEPLGYEALAKSRSSSPTGRCRPFDRGADGAVLGEGVAVLVLRRLSDAIEDGDRVHAIIRGAAVSHAGAAATLSGPSIASQREVIERAFADAGDGFDPAGVTYVEAHGAATLIADAMEIEALSQVFRAKTGDRQYCAIGTAKTSIGHLEAAAGIAGIVKVASMMHHREVPSSGPTEVSPLIDFERSPFRPAVSAARFEPRRAGEPLRAAVNAFGLGGSAAHVLLESFEAQHTKLERPWWMFSALGVEEPKLPPVRRGFPFALSASSRPALEALIERWQRFVGAPGLDRFDLRSLCATAMTSRTAFPYRFGGIVHDHHELRELLHHGRPSKPNTAPWIVRIGSVELSGFAEILPGLRNSPLFARRLASVLSSLAEATRFFADEWLAADRPVFSLIASYARISALMELGFSPAGIVGHPEGGWLASLVAGMVTLEGCVRVMTGRANVAEIALSRPRIDWYDPQLERVVRRYRFDAAYVARLKDGAAAISSDLGPLVRRTLALRDLEPVFRSQLRGWDAALEPWERTTDQLLHDEALLSEGGAPGKQRALLAAICWSTLARFSKKWRLDAPEISGPPALRELVHLLVDGVMPPEVACAIFLESRVPIVLPGDAGIEWGEVTASIPELRAADIAAATAILEERQSHLDETRAYEILRSADAGLDAASFESIFEPAASRPATFSREDRSELRVGRFLAERDRAARHSQDLAFDLPFDEEALRLWLAGVDLSWSALYDDFTRVPLPGYAFIRKSVAPSAEPREEVADAGAKARVYFRPRWDREPSARSGTPSDEPLLVFGASQTARSAARAHVADGAPITLVLPGDQFDQLDAETFLIAPDNGHDYVRLIQLLKRERMLPRRIVHCWSERPRDESSASLAASLRRGFWSFMHLSRALLSQPGLPRTRLLYVSASRGAEPSPLDAGIAALARAVRLESPLLEASSIEVHCDDAVRQEDEIERLLEAASVELARSEVEVRHRDQHRHVRRLVETDERAIETSKAAPSIADGSVCLITGGLGGIGALFAEHLARKHAIKLVLVGPSELDAREREVLRRIEAHGREVLYVRADVSKEAEASALADQVGRRFGRVDGIIHAASALITDFLVRLKANDVAATLAPKVLGAYNLDRVFRDERLSFFVLFSSITSVHAGEGLSAFGYANAVLDHFAEQRTAMVRRGARSGRTLAILWPFWDLEGLRPSREVQESFSRSTGLSLLPAEEGLRAFDLLLGHESPSPCLVGFGDPDRAKRALCASANELREGRPEEAVAVDRGLLAKRTLRLLRELLAEVLDLPVEAIDPSERIDAHAIDSVIVQRFNARIEQELGPTSKTLLYLLPTVQDLVAFFLEHHSRELAERFALLE